jgi:hypothetical protein
VTTAKDADKVLAELDALIAAEAKKSSAKVGGVVARKR